MCNKSWAAVGLVASVATSAGPAIAADILTRPPPAAAVAQPFPPAPPPVSDWTGLYIGAHAGGGWGHLSFSPSEFDNFGPATVFPQTTTMQGGGVWGGQVGYNWQWGTMVGGLEIDFSGADIHESNTFLFPTNGTINTFANDAKIDQLASARGRLGWLIYPNLLAYGTGGIGWGHFRFRSTATDGFGDFATEETFSNEFGWVAGAGLEWKFASNWLLRGEWLHYDFGTLTNPHTDFLANNFMLDNGNFRASVDVARAALSYKF
jgi:outer membrane immunogenic protein